MAQHNFEHLPLLLRYRGPARLRGFAKPSPQTLANRNARAAHSDTLRAATKSLTTTWQQRQAQREAAALPVIPKNIPVLLKVDPSLDLDVLREKFSFEIVAEQEDGYVIVATEDIEVTSFVKMLDGFSVAVHGSATIAQVHGILDEGDRLARILSERLLGDWPAISDQQPYIVDVGIACTGTVEIPPPPTRGKRDTDVQWAEKQSAWANNRLAAYDAWDAIKMQRENEIIAFAQAYNADILHLIDGAEFDAAVLPDSFTIRLKISGKGLKDFVLNYPYIFEVVEPENVALPQVPAVPGAPEVPPIAPVAPANDAPAICIIDSGIQEQHAFLAPAVDADSSHCFLPEADPADVADYVAPGGHGTRVAGAALYGDEIPKQGTPQLPFWIQNARVLDEHNQMPVELFPPEVLRAAIRRFHNGDRHTRIFNHSINAQGYCRTRYMSAWAAEMDQLCSENDVLIVQSAGNIPITGAAPYIGIKDHLTAGRKHPAFLIENAARVANPAQSLQALTVGSITYDTATAGEWRTFTSRPDYPSAFSRSGPGIWQTIKPEVVEYGGDCVHTANEPPDVHPGGVVPGACPELIRSTMHAPGPAYDRDETGTSFAAPKVARMAAELQRLMPNQPALLYRALIVQSAHWPAWAEAVLGKLRSNADLTEEQRQKLIASAQRTIRCIGYGIPELARATSNSDYRTTFITNGESLVRAGDCHIYQVPIPPVMRQPGDDFDVRIDVTLSYVAQPRRTRRNLRRYLSTWVDWKSNNLGEALNDFRVRAMADTEKDEDALPWSALPWTIHERGHWGVIRQVKRNNGTVQKDWALVKSNMLPEHFCVAVVGHQGWSRDPDSVARYSLAVTLEMVGQEIPIYEPLLASVGELQAEIAEAEAEVEVEVEE